MCGGGKKMDRLFCTARRVIDQKGIPCDCEIDQRKAKATKEGSEEKHSRPMGYALFLTSALLQIGLLRQMMGNAHSFPTVLNAGSPRDPSDGTAGF